MSVIVCHLSTFISSKKLEVRYHFHLAPKNYKFSPMFVSDHSYRYFCTEVDLLISGQNLFLFVIIRRFQLMIGSFSSNYNS